MTGPLDPPPGGPPLSSRLQAEALALAGVGLFAYDLTTALQFVDEAALSVLGRRGARDIPEAAVGQSVEAFLRCALPVELDPEVLRARGGREAEREIAVEAGDGRSRWLQVNARWLDVPEGGLVLAVIRDVTPRRTAQQGLARAQRLESLGNLAGGIAHDFNNHLMAILGHVSVARDALDEPAEATTFLDLAEASVHRARGLALRLLTFARGGEPLRRVCGLESILRDAAAIAVAGSNTRCDLRFGRDVWSVCGDPDQLRQLFQNLLVNADEAMPEGGVVRVTASNVSRREDDERGLSAGDYVRVRVGDRGSGLDETQREHLFEPYFTTKPGASGLGLATAHSIVRKHGGWVDVRSRPGRGTTVEVLLPAIAAAGESAGAGASPAPSRLRGRILVMDDEEDLRLVLSHMLSRLGLETETKADGAAAIEAYRAAQAGGSPFDAVILDLTVPGGMGGRDASRALLALDARAQLVVSSGYSHDDLIANHAQHGFVAALPKPYTLDQLRAVLSPLLGGHAT